MKATINSLFYLILCIFFNIFVHANENEEISRVITPRGSYTQLGDNKEIVEEFYKAIENSDEKKLNSIMAVNYQIVDAGALFDTDYSRYPALSKNLKERIKFLHEAFPNFSIKVTETIAEGNKVSVRTLLSGVQKGTFLGIAPTNKPVLIKTFAVFTVKKGKITMISEMWNELGVMKQLGYIAL